MIIGVASVVAMVALGSGAQAQVGAPRSRLGSNLLIVCRLALARAGCARKRAGHGGIRRRSMTLRRSGQQVEGVLVVAPSRLGRKLLPGWPDWNPQVEGVTPDYLVARDWQIAQGGCS